MKNLRSIILDRYNTPVYESFDDHIYRNKEEDTYVTALSFELEADEDSQYPLEDLLDRFSLYISGFINPDRIESQYMSLEFAGDPEDLREFLKTVIGKRVYNIEVEGEDGKTYVKLIIE
ncbi:hypothetical protein [uncultured Chryseobacterium sp.]|uniref:hypothetical protein n=1 Tax=uncultured Chryseobacterium sp. TaxID=259322 RepID=UPI0025E3F565|nr:hypothetical protein [uncultured Chryseobacterium sp.]